MSHLSFSLPQEFIDGYRDQTVSWDTLGEITYLRTYSRRRDDGTKERWFETVRRVVEGCYSIQKDWCIDNRIPWDEEKAIGSAREMYERIFTFKFTPPGRGLWMMGTEFVHERKNSAPLQNCAFVSTDDVANATAFLMEALMLGVGVGFDTRGEGTKVYQPSSHVNQYTIPDTREGWVEATIRILKSYLHQDSPNVVLDYSQIRPAGSPIKGFGGIASGPEPLKDLHLDMWRILDRAVGHRGYLTQKDITDIMNLVGRCVVAGNVRRSAEIALGSGEEFLDLKDYEKHPDRVDWGWASNNSLVTTLGQHDYKDVAERVVQTGEPGIFWLDLSRSHGRLVDPPNNKDFRATGTNPCGEQTLESYECCNLVETFPTNHDTLEDYHRTLKFAYLYAKSVTLLPTHWPETNAIMQRNRRIGCSMSGIVQFSENRGLLELRAWMDSGYDVIQDWDRVYSEWLCVRESIKTTSVKPSGTVSLLAGVTPGVHFPVARTYVRRIRLAWNDPLVTTLKSHGYHVEPAVTDPAGTAVASIPVQGPQVRTESEATVWEKAAIAVLAQRYWADNQVSVTLTFDAEKEADQLAYLLHTHEGQLKSVSMLPMSNDTYQQMPYQSITEEQYKTMLADVKPIDFDTLYGSGTMDDAIGEKYCTSDVCEVSYEEV